MSISRRRFSVPLVVTPAERRGVLKAERLIDREGQIIPAGQPDRFFHINCQPAPSSSGISVLGSVPSNQVRYSVKDRSRAMTPADFRRIALSLEGAEEVSHAALPAFRVGGRRFASLASQAEGYGNLTLTLEHQAAFVEEAPEIFLHIPGGFW